MGKWLSNPIPVLWFAVLITAYITTSTWGYFQDYLHGARMDTFMAEGGRFTKEDGDRLEARILKLEETCEQ